MTTQVIFKIDKAIKTKAQKKAKAHGLTFTDVLKMATYAYVQNDFEPGLVPTEKKLKPAVQRQLLKISEDIKAGKNLSPAFDNADEMIAYLKSVR
jgi:antitoxin component of RelBE/YafQ-DinJ toxin-antitoxin module